MTKFYYRFEDLGNVQCWQSYVEKELLPTW
jgi:hypothetical protein